MSPDKASVTVRIAGEEHTIRASAEPEYTKRCAKLVDDHIHEIRVRAGLIKGHRAAILAALSIADQCFQAVDELEQVRKETASRATNLTRRIAAELPEQTGGD